MDKNKAKELGADIVKALEDVARRHGMTVELKGGTFDTTGVFKPRLEFRTADASANEFARLAPLYGLGAADFGRVFSYGGNSYRVDGISPNRTGKPILATRSANGKGYRFPADVVKARLADPLNAKLNG